MRNFWWFWLALTMAGAAHADSIYKTVGPDGSVSFGDVPVEGSERIQLRLPARDPNAIAIAAAETERMLAVAERLAAGRVQRELLRLERASRVGEIQALERRDQRLAEQPNFGYSRRATGFAVPVAPVLLLPAQDQIPAVAPAPFSRFAPAFRPIAPAFGP